MLKITGWQVIFNIVLFLVAFLILKPSLKGKHCVNKGQRAFAIFVLFIFFVFGYNDLDYLHYKQLLLERNPYELLHLEVVYLGLLDIVNYSHLLFRIIVFGGALLLYLLSIKRLNVDFDLNLLFFVVICAVISNYGRWTLALSISFLGFSFIAKPINQQWLVRLVSYLIGFLLISVSLFFHRSILILVPLYIVVLFIKSMNKAKLYFMILVLMAVVYFLYYYGAELIPLITTADSLEQFEASRSVGEVAGQGDIGIGMIINYTFENIARYLSIFLYIKLILRGYYKKWPLEMKLVSTLVIVIMLFSSFFLIPMGGLDMFTLYYRFMFFSSFPMCIFCAYAYQRNELRHMVMTIFYFSLIYQIYNMSYHAYHAFLGIWVV